MGENELFKDKIEVSLDGRQIFYLFFGGAIIASLVFVLGVMVGKRLESRAHIHASADTSIASDPLAALDKLAGKANPLTFPATLIGKTSEPQAKVDQVLNAKIQEQQVETKKLDAEMAARHKAEERQQAQREAEKKRREAKKREAEKKKREAEKKKREAEKKTREAEAKKRDQAAEIVAADKSAEEAPKVYTLQLSSFRDKEEADSFFQQLSRAGYAPYLIEAKVKGQSWFRVRLGRYSSYSDAIEAKSRFEKKQKIIAYVTRVRG